MNQFQVWVTGNVATQVRHAVTSSGITVADFRLASTPRRRDAEHGWVDGDTTFVKVTCYKALADNVSASLGVGQPVVVVGRLRVEETSRDGHTYRDTVVVASAVGPDLSRGTAAFRRSSARATPSPASPELPGGREDVPDPPSAAGAPGQAA
jgi:single-strand DNA-binding protein